MDGLYAAWKNQDDWYQFELSGDDLADFLQFMQKRRAGPPRSDPAFDITTMDRVVLHFFPFPEGAVSLVAEALLSEAALHEVHRLTNAFAFAYTRFLDLKQAEEQAREAQIEAALERIRARSMGMRRSDELAEVSVVLFQQLKALGLYFDLTCVCEIDEQTDTATVWSTDLEGRLDPRSVAIPLNEFPAGKRMYRAWQHCAPEVRKGQVLVTEYTEQALQDIFAWLPTLPDYQEDATAQYYQGNLDESPTRVIGHDAFFSHGYLTILSTDRFDEAELDILKRFAGVFEQAYTRFLDLKKAEEQARAAVRAASLDRVRAEIATMRTAPDLQRITPLVWRELTTLDVPFFRCGVIIVDEANEHVEMFLSNSYGKQLADLQLPFESHPLIQNAVATWRNQQVFADQWEQERLVAWVQFLMGRGDIAQPDNYMDREGPPPMLALHLVPFAQGLLYVGSPEPLSDDQVDLVQALADAFAVAYARYEDFKRLEAAKADVEATLNHLKATQAQLIQAEKMASLGQLTAGIAHEIKNPLNFVNNFALLSTELADELAGELDAHADKTVAEVRADLDELLADLRLNTEKIEEHGKRADGIVRAMMDHARGGEVERRATDINGLLDEYINLAYHGMRAATPDFNVTIERDLDGAVGKVDLVPQEIGRVFINVLNNAFYAVHRKAASATEAYAPAVQIHTRRAADTVEIRIEDNGPGIEQTLIEKIFEPFYTTKPTGKGTGLGLSLSYDIVTQGHGGTLTVESEAGEGAAFVVCLPAPPAS